MQEETIQILRRIILDTDPQIAEQVKWNAPAFHYTGDMKPFNPKEYKRDIVVFNLRQKDHLLLVFPTGARLQHALLEGDYADGRRMLKIHGPEDAKAKAHALQEIIRQWVDTVE
ncbi:DUF1801 domain-containing protein [Chitinophaga lutea]